MYFVDNINLEACRSRRVAHIFDNLANIGNAGARSRIHLYDINMAAIHNGLAMGAGLGEVHAGYVGVIARIVQRPGQNARGRSFANPAHAGQHKRMRDTAGFKGIGQCPHHGFLTDKIVKIAGAIFARQNLIAPRGDLSGLYIILRVSFGQHVKTRRFRINHRRVMFCVVFRRLVFVLCHEIGDNP